MQYVLLLSLLVSCTSVEKDVTLTQTVFTKSISFVDNEYALSEKEAVEKAEQFLLGIENSRQGDGESRSISALNLSEKEPQIETIIRYIEYKRDELNNYEQVPVYIINYTNKKSKKGGGYVILTGDKRVNNILVYSDTGAWDNENPEAQRFLHWFWISVDKSITSELKGNNMSLKTKSNDPCEYDIETYYSESTKLLAQLTLWNSKVPFNIKLEYTTACGSLPRYYDAGCTPVAMAQIMAHHRKPTSGSYVNYANQPVNTTYEWIEMLKSNYHAHIQHLIAEIGYHAGTKYGCDGGETDMQGAKAGFVTMGYSTSNIAWFQYSTIVSEINVDRPVLGGSGDDQPNSTFTEHSWMIDGYSTHTYVETITQYCPWQPPTIITNNVFSYYVHCNMGQLDTDYNTYYNSTIFGNLTTQILTAQ